MTGADPAVCFFAVCFVIMAASLCRKLLLALLPQQVDQAVIHKNSKKSTGFIAGGETTVCAAAEPEAAPGQPISINYHFLRSCNYNCGFCFHTAITSHVEPIERAAKALQLFREAGCHKVNFSGGEPFLHEGGEYVGQLCRIAREDLKYSSVSIVSNGSLITEEWFVKYGNFLDILAVSCDSFDDQTNKRIGRMDRTTRTVPHADKLRLISVWCEKYNVRFKINTTVNRHNLDEDFTVHLSKLQPFRWKVFQCLEVQGENKGPGAKRSAASFLVTNEEFDQFVRHHQVSLANTKVKVVPEDNTAMRASYIILDEFLRLLDCSSGAKKPSDCVLDVGVEKAMQQSGFDQDMFARRGGQYPWRKTENDLVIFGAPRHI